MLASQEARPFGAYAAICLPARSRRHFSPVVSRSLLLLFTLLLTAADAAGVGRFAVCRMEMAGTTEEPGCGHCPPAAAPTVRDGLPDCCAVHAAARPLPALSGEAMGSTRHGATLAVLPTALPVSIPMARRGPAPLLLARATAPPSTRNFPLLR